MTLVLILRGSVGVGDGAEVISVCPPAATALTQGSVAAGSLTEASVLAGTLSTAAVGAGALARPCD